MSERCHHTRPVNAKTPCPECVTDPRPVREDLSRWLHRPPLHLKVEHSYWTTETFRHMPDTFRTSLWFGNLSDPEPTDPYKSLNEYCSLVWVKDFPDDGVSAQTLPAIEKAFAALDVQEILKRSVSEEEASLRIAEAHLHVAKRRLGVLQGLCPHNWSPMPDESFCRDCAREKRA